MKHPTVAVVGAGFAGIQAARAIQRKLPNAELVVYTSADVATMVPALPDLISGRLNKPELTRPLSDVLGPKVAIVVDEIRGVRLAQRELVGRNETYHYDGLILAAGSIPNDVPTAFESVRVFTAHSLSATQELRRALERQVTAPDVGLLVIGAGYTGLEIAIAVDDGTPGRSVPITVVDAATELLPMLDRREREAAREVLAARGVYVKGGTTVTRLAPLPGAPDLCSATLSDGTVLDRVIVCWLAGMRAVRLNLEPEVNLTRDGRIEVEETLQLPSYPEVCVAGDLAALRDGDRVLRRAVNFAFYSGRQAGRNLAAHLSRKGARPFSPFDLGYVLPLGDATAGRALGKIPLRGRFALRTHYLMCGFRHFGGGKARRFYSTALRLRRLPAPLVASPHSEAR